MQGNVGVLNIFDTLQLISQYREMEEYFSVNCNEIFFSVKDQSH